MNDQNQDYPFHSSGLEYFQKHEKKLLRYSLFKDLVSASVELKSFKLELLVKKTSPKMAIITFTQDDLSLLKSLKEYTGEYGFTVRIKASRNKKILRGEKKLRYAN